MKENVGSRLPNFTAEEIAKVNGSLDFIGLNVQTAFYTYNKDFYTDASEDKKCYYLDWGADVTSEREGVPIGEVNLSISIALARIKYVLALFDGSER
jgi:hypothetical protein